MKKYIFYKLLKLYTPFLCALTAIIHGVFYLFDTGYYFRMAFGDITGHSILLLLFVLYHSKRMCKWYKRSIYMLMMVHVVNVLYYIIDFFPIWFVLYGGLVLNIASMMCWLIFISTRTIKRIFCS